MSYEGLSPEVVDRAKYLALDFLGVASRGSREKSSGVVHSFVTDVDGAAGGCVVIGSELRASAHYAALANGAAAHSLELDDVSNDSSSHPGVAVFPTALAIVYGRASLDEYTEANLKSPEVKEIMRSHTHPHSRS